MKKCKNCKEEIAKSAKVCPKCGAKLGMPGWAKALIIIAVILGCLIACVNSCSNAVNESVEETKNSYKDINGKTSFGVNQSFQNKDEKITMTEVNTNFTDYGKYSEPKSGYKYVMAKFEIESVNSENDELYVSEFDFHADADGIAVERGYIGNENYKDLSATLGKGKKTIGYLFYEVPQNAQKITIEYNASFWNEGTSIEFIVQ